MRSARLFLEFECSGNCKRPGSAGVPGKAGKFAIIPIPKFKEEPGALRPQHNFYLLTVKLSMETMALP